MLTDTESYVLKQTEIRRRTESWFTYCSSRSACHAISSTNTSTAPQTVIQAEALGLKNSLNTDGQGLLQNMNAVCVQMHMLSSIRPGRHGSIRIQHKAPLKPLSSTMHLWERQTWPRYLLRGVRDPCVLLWNLLTWDTLITASFDKMFVETAYIALMFWYMRNQ